MPGNDEFVDGCDVLTLRVGLARFETRPPLDDSFVLSAQWHYRHHRQVVVQRQRRFLEAVGERQVALIDRQQALAQDRAILQGEPTNAADQAIRLAVLDNALGDGRVPFADLAKLLQDVPNLPCVAVDDSRKLNYRHVQYLLIHRFNQ